MAALPGEGTDSEDYHRSLFLTKTASLTWLEMQGIQARKFTINEMAMRSIILPEHLTKADNSIGDVNSVLRRVHLQSMCIDSGTENQFPFAIGIRVNGFPCQEFTASGDAFNFIIPAKSKMRTPMSIFESRGDENLHLTWQAEYAKWNMENLDTLMAMIVPESEVMLVHNEHPALQMLERRPEVFGVTSAIFTASSTPNWKHVQRSAFDAASRWIKTNILNKSSRTFDMSQLTVTFSKVDNTKWTDLCPECFVGMEFDGVDSVDDLNELKSLYANVLLQRPHTLNLKIGLRYRLSA